MDIDTSERMVLEFLADRKLMCSSFSKEEMRQNATPDFRVFQNGEFRFFCEVKSIAYDDYINKQLNLIPPGTIVERLRCDPIFNRISDDIHQSIKQFDAVNSNLKYPNVLALVNNDPLCRMHDLYEVFTGNFRADDGMLYPILKKYSEGRIREEKNRIHMFLWIDACQNSHNFVFTNTNNIHCRNLCIWFGRDPDSIKKY